MNPGARQKGQRHEFGWLYKEGVDENPVNGRLGPGDVGLRMEFELILSGAMSTQGQVFEIRECSHYSFES